MSCSRLLNVQGSSRVGITCPTYLLSTVMWRRLLTSSRPLRSTCCTSCLSRVECKHWTLIWLWVIMTYAVAYLHASVQATHCTCAGRRSRRSTDACSSCSCTCCDGRYQVAMGGVHEWDRWSQMWWLVMWLKVNCLLPVCLIIMTLPLWRAPVTAHIRNRMK